MPSRSKADEVTVSSSGWLDPSKYPFCQILESQLEPILEELERIIPMKVWSVWGSAHYSHNITRMTADDIRQTLESQQTGVGEGEEPGWRVFGLQLMGRPFERNCGLCPHTSDILARIPGLVGAGFSCLEAGYRTRRHTGSYPVYRAHLGLIVPEGDCALSVDDEARQWAPGRVLMFDDLHPHEAWNHTEAHRYVLIVDVAP